MADAGLLPERGVELLDGEIVEMRTDGTPHPRRFTPDDYLRMVELGILEEDEPIELLDGEIVEMSPEGDAHAEGVRRVNTALVLAYAPAGFAVGPQSTHRAKPSSMPEPDACVVPETTRGVADVEQSVLLVEVSDTSLAKDRARKRRMYAVAGAPCYWIIEIPHRQVRVLEEPQGGDYRSERVVGDNGVLSLPVVGAPVAVADILPVR
jgi:Uma2 family endonuclease